MNRKTAVVACIATGLALFPLGGALVRGTIGKPKTSAANTSEPVFVEELKELNDSAVSPDVKEGGFSQKAVIEYCRMHAMEGTYNERLYPTWPGLDCTNFVSQVLHYAGWEFTGRWSNRDDWSSWYCECVKTSTGYEHAWSTTWINADQWYHHAVNTGRAVRIYDWSDLRVGDVILVDWTNDDKLDHCMIVTTDANGDYRNVRISSHCPDQFDYPFTEELRRYSGSDSQVSWYAMSLVH